MTTENFTASAKGKNFAYKLYKEIREVLERNQKICPDDNYPAYLIKALAGQFMHFKGTELEALGIAKEYVEEDLMNDIAEGILNSGGTVVRQAPDGSLIKEKN